MMRFHDNINYICIRSHDINIVQHHKLPNAHKYTIVNIIENPFDYTIYLKKDLTPDYKTIELDIEKDDFHYKIGDIIYLEFPGNKLIVF